NRLKYPQKFTLITLLLVCPLALVLYFFISEINIGIGIAGKERDGIRYLRVVARLLQHVSEAKGFAHAYAAGEVAERPTLIRKQAEIAVDVASLEAVDRELGRLLETERRLGTLRENWRFLEKKTADLSAAENGSLYAELTSEAQDLLARVGDTSTL